VSDTGSPEPLVETCYHAINTQDEYIQLSRLIDLLTWAPSCLVYPNCHNSALNYNLYLLNSSKVIQEKISGSGRTELSTFVVRVTHFTDLEIRKLHLSNFLNIFRHLIIIYRDVPKVSDHCNFLLYISCKTTFFKSIIPKSTLVRF
jgi:hypothetical protein